jgi:ubiquinone biosynthesis protein
MEEIPKELRSLLQKLEENKFTVTSEIKNIDKTHQLIKSSIVNLILAMVLGANIIASAILWNSESADHISGISVVMILCFLWSMVLMIVLCLRLLKR